MDWRELDHIHRAALGVGLTTWVRLPSNPWLGETESARCRLRSTRSAHSVSASKSSVRPSRRRVRRAHAWMWRTTGIVVSDSNDIPGNHKKGKDVAVFVRTWRPSRKSMKFSRLDSVRIVMLVMTDLSKALGHVDIPMSGGAGDSIVEKAAKRNIAVAAEAWATTPISNVAARAPNAAAWRAPVPLIGCRQHARLLRDTMPKSGIADVSCDSSTPSCYKRRGEERHSRWQRCNESTPASLAAAVGNVSRHPGRRTVLSITSSRRAWSRSS